MISRHTIALLVVGLALGGCGGGGGDEDGAAPPPDATDPMLGGPRMETTAPPGDDPRPSLEVSVEQSIVDAEPAFAQAMLDRLTALAAPINAVSNVFGGVTVAIDYERCGTPNAFYSPGERRIIVCDELLPLLADFFGRQLAEEPEAEREELALSAALSAMAFVLYHEFAHALDDISNVPAGGNFESVADGIGTVIAAETDQHYAIYTAAFFFLDNPQASLADEHGNGIDRAGDMFCWLVGSNSQVAAQLPQITQDLADAGRDCTGEYFDQRDFVYTLAPQFRNLPPSGAAQAGRAKAGGASPVYIDTSLAGRLR